MNTIFQPNFMSPCFSSIDMSKDQIFSARVNGSKIDSYQIVAKKSSDNTVLWDSTKVSLSTLLGDGDILQVTIAANTITYYGDIIWFLTYWNGTENVTSTGVLFTNMSTPVVTTNTPTTIENKQFNFSATYSQAENIPNMKYKYTLYAEKRIIDCGHVGQEVNGDIIDCGAIGDTVNGKHIDLGTV